MSLPCVKVSVQVEPAGQRYDCLLDESLLKGMLRLGKRGIPAGCVSGGCGVCKVRILAGETVRLGPVSRAHVSLDEERQGYTLACRVAPRTHVLLEACQLLARPLSRQASPPEPSRGAAPEPPPSIHP